ncbi:MAG: mercuric reductase [Chloroflexi bacterium]|nr:mercuric reductase [Chloroflexota bacterium]
MAEQYDAIVIGAGQSGGPLSTALVSAGHKVALVEREHAGGTCVNVGCTPTKTMIASARAAYMARRSEDYGVHTGEVTIDLAKVRQRKRDIVESWSSGSENAIRNGGVDYIDGEARFIAGKTLEVTLNEGGTRELSADLIFINTGLRNRTLPLDGIESVPVLDSTSLMELGEVPDHLIMIGGGYIGLEFGQMFCRFGAGVTILEVGDRLAPREDEDISEELGKILTEDGITIIYRAQAKRLAQDDDGQVSVTFDTPDGEQTVTGSHIVMSAGRVPNSDRLNLEAAGVETDDHGYIKVNDKLETNVHGIYALGDVHGGPAFTHISYDDFRIVRTNLIEDGDASTDGRLVPYTLFTDPQLGRVGLTEQEAREQGYKVLVAKLPMAHVARAIEVEETRGFMKAVVDGDTDQILGAAILGIEGGEVMAVLQMAMMGQVPYTAIRDGIFAHPTLAESLNNLFMGMATN